jgi:hypothetical protein
MYNNVMLCFMAQALQDPPLCSSTVSKLYHFSSTIPNCHHLLILRPGLYSNGDAEHSLSAFMAIAHIHSISIQPHIFLGDLALGVKILPEPTSNLFSCSIPEIPPCPTNENSACFFILLCYIAMSLQQRLAGQN